jgi:tRNA1(Val) A37 N6-methylase TrmN6
LARVPEARVTGVEANPDYAALARRNAERNGLAERLTVITGDALRAGKRDGPPGLAPGTFHHAFANPPFHAESGAQASPEPGKAAAHILPEDAPLAAWVRALARMVRPKGTITLIQPAAALPGLLAAMREAKLGGIAIAPIWPRAGAPAGRVLVRARRGVKTPAALLPGLVLHKADNAFTDEAERILRHGAAFDWRERG